MMNSEHMSTSTPKTMPPPSVDRRPHVEDWMYIWGEIEQVRRKDGDLAAVNLCGGPAGSRRGGFSLQNSLLIHADVDRCLNRFGPYAKEMVGLHYVDDWEWSEEMESTIWKDGTTTSRPTGRFVRQHEHKVKHHLRRTIGDIVRSVGKELGLKLRS